MSKKNRATLKTFFHEGCMPTQANFEDLIDSSVNIVDDGFYKNMKDGIIIAPSGKSQKLITFYENTEYKSPAWSFNLKTEDSNGALVINNNKEKPCFYAGQDGNNGINTDTPIAPLHVNGFTASDGRLGTYKMGEVPANGEWQTLIPSLSGCHAFEIVARAGGKETEGKYVLMHAIAVATYGKSSMRIRKTQSYYGWFWNKMSLRWTGDTFDYYLQIKTRRSFGDTARIHFHITKLWDDSCINNFY